MARRKSVMLVLLSLILLPWALPGGAAESAPDEGTPVASPVASPVATGPKCNLDLLSTTVADMSAPDPQATAIPTPTPMIEASAGEATAVVRPIRNLIVCAAAGNSDALALLATVLPAGPSPDWLSDLRVGASIGMPSVGNIRGRGSGNSRAEVLWRLGSSERSEIWSMYRDDYGWRIKGIEPMRNYLIREETGIDLRIQDGSLVAARDAVSHSGRLVLRFRNEASTTASAAALFVSTTEFILDPPPPPAGLTYAGDLTLPPGSEHDLVLIDIPPSTTRLQVFVWIRGPDGQPVEQSLVLHLNSITGTTTPGT